MISAAPVAASSSGMPKKFGLLPGALISSLNSSLRRR